MSARSKARRRALDMLYAADVRSEPIADVLAREAERAAAEPDRVASWRYARQVVEGVDDHLEAIDEQIATFSRGWTIDRMPAVDRAVLRIGAWELRWNDDIPKAVAISEAVRIAKEYSTEDSARFVNGVLGAIADQ